MPIRSAAILALALAASAAHAGAVGDWSPFRDSTIADLGMDWATIGSVRNDPYIVQPSSPFDDPREVGRVNYRYRISKTEVTNEQWFGFVQAFAPYIDEISPTPFNGDFTGSGVQYQGRDGNGVPIYTLTESKRNEPVTTSWWYAARFINWLHNDKGPEREAFATGVYEEALFFAEDGDGNPLMHAHRLEGARYFLATRDERTKAMYYDPDRYGEGQGGYWQYPNSSDTPPTAGHPHEGGESNAGEPADGGQYPFDVGSYPHVTSPWGLLDGSGGVIELLEDPDGDNTRRRYIAGTGFDDPNGDLAIFFRDRIGVDGVGSDPYTGIRLASVVPAPVSGAVLALGVAAMRRRR